MSELFSRNNSNQIQQTKSAQNRQRFALGQENSLLYPHVRALSWLKAFDEWVLEYLDIIILH